MKSNLTRPPTEEIQTLKGLPDHEIDTSDLPELKGWRHAEVGKFYRPIKKPVTIRLDADVLAWLKSQGTGYQTRLNALSRRAMEKEAAIGRQNGGTQEFIQAQKNNLDRGSQSPIFRELVGALDQAYRTIVERHDPGTPPFYGRLLLICHKSMLSAASLIAQSQPDDSAGVTRRAVEAAKVALAIKLNDKNALQWVSFQERHDRWIRRQQKRKPKRFHVQFKNLKADPLAKDLDKFLGILSDAYVHFTPEYYSSLDWEEKRKTDSGGEIFLNYFHRDAREIERHLIVLGAVHGLILKAFDKCFEGGISEDPEMLDAVNKFWQAGRRVNDEYQRKYGVAPEPALWLADVLSAA